jgi:PIN domain nuclease of toxin-antitoxin system
VSAVLADTHSILWYLFDPPRLSVRASGALTAAEQAGAEIYVSAVTVVEVRYLVEKRRVPRSYLDDLVAALVDPAAPAELIPVSLDIARAVEHIPRSIVPDMPDRIIAATAHLLNLPLVTADRRIQAAPIQTIW